MIAVTGATGAVGGLVARELARLGLPFRMLVRDADRAPDPASLAAGHVQADVVVGGYEDADALAQLLDPGGRVFMVSLFAPASERVPLHRAFVEAAVTRRVGHVVYLSFVGAGPDATFTHARSHGATEEMLAASGLSYTAVRNAMYTDEIPDWFDAEGRITGPAGDGRVSFSYRPELGEAIAVLLADGAHDHRRTVTVTGDERVTCAELAATATEVTGDPYTYVPSDRESWQEYRRARGRSPWSIEAGLSYYDGVARGEGAVVGDDYRRLTGREPATIAQVIDHLRDRMPLSRLR